MEIMEIGVLLKQWASLVSSLEKLYGEKPTLEVVLFLIGVQELGSRQTNFSKDEKQDLIHIAICRVMSYWGYYSFQGKDKDGWPIWESASDIPYMGLQQQSQLLRQGIIAYFRENKFEF